MDIFNLGKITGICSKYLKSLQENSPVYFSLKEGTLTFPSDPLVPFMVVGPGTGIAPFISFLEEREAISVEQSVTMSRHKHLVFFGCRNKEKDWLHKDIMSRMQKDEKYGSDSDLGSLYSMRSQEIKTRKYMCSI
jgi:cytochrome P450 / NADPH-cytochrome P450 reductase